MRRTTHRRPWRLLTTTGIVTLVAALGSGVPAAGAAGGTVTGAKTATPADIDCDGTADVRVVLDGESGIVGEPADVMLVLDRSGSMSGAPLANLKTAANALIDKLDQATDGALDGVIGNGTRVGVVSFAGAALLDEPLTANAAAAKAAVSSLAAGGGTNHEHAFQTAQAQLAGGTAKDHMIVVTDGRTTSGGDPSDDAAAARAAGTTIYAIGFGGVDVAALNDWATDPDSAHVFVTPDSNDLEAIFQAIGAAIVVPAATDIEVVDTVNGHFAISDVAVTKGSVVQSGNELTWKIAELGTEQAVLTYRMTHDASRPGGTETVGTATYGDAEGHALDLGAPEVDVHGCPATIDVTPAHEDNELGTPGQTHSVTATLLDDFGDPIAGSPILFAITGGPNAGANGSDATDGSGEADFTYAAQQGPSGLGTDTIRACLEATALCDAATKRWQDTTAPSRACVPTTNPGGQRIPQANDEDGFFVLTADDAVDPNPEIFVVDTGSGTVFGPFADGTRIKYTQSPGGKPSQKPMTGVIDWHIRGTGDAAVYAVDDSGNRSSSVSCKVAPPPK